MKRIAFNILRTAFRAGLIGRDQYDRTAGRLNITPPPRVRVRITELCK